MTNFTPTPEQLEIIRFSEEEDTNLAVVARAGAAKTSTLILIAEALPRKDILCLAFNKAIATEMKERLPENCTSTTLHSLGFRAWKGFIRKPANLDNRKSYRLLKELVDGMGKDDQAEFYELFSETLDYIGTAKQTGYLPKSYKGHWKPLISEPDVFYSGLPMELTGTQERLINEVLVRSFKEALDGNLDFDDMIYCPAICSVAWPVHDLYLVDEAQDLSPLNHHIVKKLVKKRRLITVGDPLQAIYGFRGADTHSMQKLTNIFEMETLNLTISFRCGVAIVKEAQWRAPDMRWPEWAKPGAVEPRVSWSVADLESGDAVICRNNAPLFKLAVIMIENDKLPELAGRDLAKPLKKVMQKLGKPGMHRDAALGALATWEEKEVKRARDGAKGQIHDKASCIRVMLQKTQDLGDAIAYLDHLLNRPGRVHLMTGHKSKGLEFDNVWFLEPKLCNMEYEQDKNLKYVIQTRAKSTLRYINFDGLAEER